MRNAILRNFFSPSSSCPLVVAKALAAFIQKTGMYVVAPPTIRWSIKTKRMKGRTWENFQKCSAADFSYQCSWKRPNCLSSYLCCSLQPYMYISAPLSTSQRSRRLVRTISEFQSRYKWAYKYTVHTRRHFLMRFSLFEAEGKDVQGYLEVHQMWLWHNWRQLPSCSSCIVVSKNTAWNASCARIAILGCDITVKDGFFVFLKEGTTWKLALIVLSVSDKCIAVKFALCYLIIIWCIIVLFLQSCLR